LRTPDLISFWPVIQHIKGYKCPSCGCQLSEAKGLFFQGTHLLADIPCSCCDVEYYHTVPLAHDAIFPVAFTKDFTKVSYDLKAKDWQALPLIVSMKEEGGLVFEVKIEVKQAAHKMVLVNCLDVCYGHVFQKVLCADWLMKHHPDMGIILLIPEDFEWMVPLDGIAEVWCINVKIKDLNKRLDGFDQKIKQGLARFSEVFIANPPVWPDASQVDYANFLKHERFDVQQFCTRPIRISLVWREDRFWHSTRWEELLYLTSMKFGFSTAIKWWYVWRQMIQFKQLTKSIFKSFPKAKVAMVGLGKAGYVGLHIEDLRLQGTHTLGEETRWFPTLASSQMVVGVLGSSMLIPTSLSASVVSIVPKYMLTHAGEDIALPYQDRKLTFFARFVVGNPSVADVALQVKSILGEAKQFLHLLK
jgi:hypothetical protein